MTRARNFDRRAFVLIAGAALLGAAWAGYNLWQAGNSREPEVFRALIWAVFAPPFFTFWGWLAARPAERWRAAFTCFMIYFVAIFAAARLERLLLGADEAAATGHALYFRLVLLFQLLACLGVALRRALRAGTIPQTADSMTRTAASSD
jgi:hypothetical protein